MKQKSRIEKINDIVAKLHLAHSKCYEHAAFRNIWEFIFSFIDAHEFNLAAQILENIRSVGVFCSLEHTDKLPAEMPSLEFIFVVKHLAAGRLKLAEKQVLELLNK